MIIEFTMLAMTWAFWLLAVGAAFAAFAAFAGPLFYSRIRRKPVGLHSLGHGRSENLGHDRSDWGHSVWCYQHGSWALLEDRSASGFVPGPPPAEPGACEDYCMKVLSVPETRGR